MRALCAGKFSQTSHHIMNKINPFSRGRMREARRQRARQVLLEHRQQRGLVARDGKQRQLDEYDENMAQRIVEIAEETDRRTKVPRLRRRIIQARMLEFIPGYLKIIRATTRTQTEKEGTSKSRSVGYGGQITEQEQHGQKEHRRLTEHDWHDECDQGQSGNGASGGGGGGVEYKKTTDMKEGK